MSDTPILFVRCDSFETFGLAPDAVRGAGADVRIWEALDGEQERPDLGDVAGVVLFGSSYNVEQADEQPFIKEVRELTREAFHGGTPFLGVCFGAQVLAWALDAEVKRAPVREVGFEPIHPTPAARSDALVSHYREGDLGFEWHMDTFELPDGAELLVTGDGVPHQAYRVGDRAWGIQYHLEVDESELRYWLDVYASKGGDIEATWGKTNEQVLEEAERHLARHEERGRETFRRFVDLVRAAGR